MDKSTAGPKLPMPNKYVEVPADILPQNVFTHINQQTAMTLEAVRLQRESCFNQMRAHEQHLLEELSNPTPISRFPVPKDVILILEIHANEFSMLIAKQDAWGKILWKLMYDIQIETKTNIMLADQICDRELSEFNRITITGPVEGVDKAQAKLFDILPIQVGLKVRHLKEEFADEDLRELSASWFFKKELNFPSVSLHFLMDKETGKKETRKYVLVIMRAAPSDYKDLIDCARKYAEKVLEEPTEAEYTWGFVIPKINRDWYIGPKAELIRDLAKHFEVMISYPLCAATGCEHNYIVHGNLENVIKASRAFRDISPVSLTFDVEESTVNSTLLNRKTPSDVFNEEFNVVISYRKSPYEGEFKQPEEPSIYRITLSTSYENKDAMYMMREKIINGRLRGEYKLPKLRFGFHLRNLLSVYGPVTLNLNGNGFDSACKMSDCKENKEPILHLSSTRHSLHSKP